MAALVALIKMCNGVIKGVNEPMLDNVKKKKKKDYIFKGYYSFDFEWAGRRNHAPGHLASHQFRATLHMQKVGEIGWQIQILLTTVESYLSSPFGSTQKCLACHGAKCAPACMITGMVLKGGKMWGDSSETWFYIGFCDSAKYANACI